MVAPVSVVTETILAIAASEATFTKAETNETYLPFTLPSRPLLSPLSIFWKEVSMAKRNAVIGQSGGPTSVINQSLVGAIQEVQKSKHIDQLLGARHGVRGIINDDFIPLSGIPADLLEAMGPP